MSRDGDPLTKETPPGSITESAPAGLLRRLAAILYDALIVFALVFIAAFVILQVAGEPLDERGRLALQITAVAIAYLYFTGFWTHGGQTIGMRAWRIRVYACDGSKVTIRAAAGRFVLALIALLPLGLGFWWSLFDPQRLAWHDRWSGTRLFRVRDS